MPTNILKGDTVRIQVTFRDWSSVGNGDIIDPDTVEVDILDENFVRTPEVEVATKVEDGVYFFDWTPLESGTFYIEFVGTFDGGQTSVVREKFVVQKVVSGPSQTGVNLGEDQELHFATILQPLYIDAEEMRPFYPEASRIEVMELINRYSLQVAEILRLDPDDPDAQPSFLALEYIRAAVQCALSRVYDYGAGGQESSLTLGDLSIVSRSYPRSTITRANAVNACELAAALYAELIRKESPMKAVVKGTKYPNPMPKRHVKSPYNGGKRR